MPHLVRERLYFGDIKDAIAALTESSSTPAFTHVLSVEGAPPTAAVPPGTLMRVVERAGDGLRVTRMAVPLRDTEEENLLDHIEPCLDFVDEGSASIIVAYLMRSEQKSLEVGIARMMVFFDQLKLFEEMGFKVDTSSPLYKRFRLNILGQSYKFGEKIGSYMFEDDPGLSPQSGSCQDSSKTEQHKTAYRCRKCRRIIAVEDNVISHVPGEGESCFDWNRRKSGRPYSNKEQDCSSLFVEPLKWMTPVEDGALEGKLSCIHCGARLGYFNWSGIQCNCGSWVTPAFQIVKTKVDISTI
ncbi:hypothetical protein GQ55_3G020500 [Panicum hallii var. hallii]|uniref:protein-tyrosine-phosphatase n=1 Tax=Panicum hallii var. hallii TaxID=1504633 RepID=A0A2T7E4U9_9POAL|nr:hypothetical protein GQ55_3G020500 [Panicum hallii var. hallii]